MSDNRWIIWQNACEATHHEILETLRKHFNDKAVTTHAETLELIEDLYLPLMPKETIDIDAEDPPTKKQLPKTDQGCSIKVSIGNRTMSERKQIMQAVQNAVEFAKISFE